MAISRNGENNPNWRGGKIKQNCVICNKEYLIPLSKKNLRKTVPVCMSHHQKAKVEEMKNLAFEETIYRKYFVELILNEYGGICYESQSDEKTTSLAEA